MAVNGDETPSAKHQRSTKTQALSLALKRWLRFVGVLHTAAVGLGLRDRHRLACLAKKAGLRFAQASRAVIELSDALGRCDVAMVSKHTYPAVEAGVVRVDVEVIPRRLERKNKQLINHALTTEGAFP